MRQLIAVKPFTYATRRLKAGDYFTARSDRDARTLLVLRKATSAVAAPHAAAAGADDLALLRAGYETVSGRRPFMGWDAPTLRAKIAAHERAPEDREP